MSANGAVGFWNTKELSQTYANNNRDFFRPTTDKVLQLAEELVDRSTAKNILDLASGTGNPAIRLALAFPDCHVHATDLAPAMLKLLDVTVADLKINNISSSVADAQDLAFAGNASYDAITFSLGLQLLKDTAKCLSECARVLKPGGALIISVPGPISKTDGARTTKEVHDRVVPNDPWMDINAMGTGDALKTAAEKAGFQQLCAAEVNNPITGSMDQMKAISIRGLLSAGLKTEDEQRKKHHGPDAKSCYAEADKVLEELLRQNGWLQAGGLIHLPSNVAIVLSAVKPMS
ncbi:hypothetical protein ABBQ32_004528 [Trebouxia sp. C0010 RCD-2024]